MLSGLTPELGRRGSCPGRPSGLPGSKVTPRPGPAPPLPTEGAGRGQNPTSQVLSTWAQGRLLRLGMFLWCNENMTLIPRLFHVTYNYPQDVLRSSPYGCRLCRDVRRVANAGASPPLPRLTL